MKYWLPYIVHYSFTGEDSVEIACHVLFIFQHEIIGLFFKRNPFSKAGRVFPESIP
jgi:tRNA U34 5-carboxymethylaminomethyl modifying GTPase MnmE/TrmE